MKLIEERPFSMVDGCSDKISLFLVYSSNSTGCSAHISHLANF